MKEVSIGNLTAKAIVDSGAAASCISYKLLCETPTSLIGPSSTPLATKGVINTHIRFDKYTILCKLHVLDSENEDFLIGWDIMCKFDKSVLKPQENSIEFSSMLVQNSDSISNVRASVNTVIPPRSQNFLKVCVDKPLGSMLIERCVNFEEKTGLILGRTVSTNEDPLIILMNLDSYSKMVYKSQIM